ncbi:hypothetical protein RJT34_12048 [Clitoria ternatea]|uniref:Uncharacterized protein n=1 Tax=Clitoria ternatea TaxID=43366 RepID=A0AAN9PL08_CLITE
MPLDIDSNDTPVIDCNKEAPDRDLNAFAFPSESSTSILLSSMPKSNDGPLHPCSSAAIVSVLYEKTRQIVDEEKTNGTS